MSDVDLSSFVINAGLASADLVAAVSSPPSFTRAIDGASTLTVEVSDHSRTLLSNPAIQGRVYATYLGFRYELVAVGKSGDRITLTFEDSLIAALRRVTTWDAIPASSVSRSEIVRRFTRQANVSALIQPGMEAIYNSAVEAGDGSSTAWELLTGLATDINLRCFSDGFNLHFGSDDWLVNLTAPLTIREFTGPVHVIDFELDAGKPVSTATVTVDAESWALYAGKGVTVEGTGWADGQWIVSGFEREATSIRGRLDLERKQFVLTEPPPTDTATSDEGEIGNLPTESSQDISADLARLRQCESGGNYKTNTGNGFYGAYQFDLRTWQGLGYTGRPDQASPATQDKAASKLYQSRGWKPWPACSKKLGLVDKRNSTPASVVASGSGGGKNAQFADAAVKAAGSKPYVWGAKGPSSFDCSGLVQYVSRQLGKTLGAPSASQAKAVPTKISVQQALNTKGALLFRIGGGETNHVAISLGDGRTVEARGKAYGCGVFGGANGRKWTSGGLLF